MLDEVISDMRQEMERTIMAMKQAMVKVRTGRASIGLLDGIMVDYYGTPTPINQLATMAVPESRLISIQPWDKGAFGPIEKAIMKSELGLTPTNDGKIIRIPIPALTEERRKDLVKMIKKMAEDYKIEIRNHRRDTNGMVKDLEKEKEINKDDMMKGLDKVQDITNDFVKKVDEIFAKKETEIMEV